jgi:hypothetical protein
MSRSDVLRLHKIMVAGLSFAAGVEPTRRLASVNTALALVSLVPQFVRSGTDSTVRLVFQPKSLSDYMVAEIAMVAHYGAKVAACQHCGTEFLTGSMTKRRASAQYCADKCRVAAMRARNA